ncbi:hypothetical protein EWM64_g1077 [Hericium alpestre]|uniref:Cytochrome P450 n=1 Tax=Hericium alpestre TaxID=135208 RepID=A0A4Z0AAF7_9AGAM|nr:hypothetical protein EWM64_g1077 [Hericium alpestre]
MASWQVLAASAVAALVFSFIFFGLIGIICHLYASFTSPLNDLQGPPSVSKITGSVEGCFESDADELWRRALHQYGPTFKFNSFFNMNKLFIVDLKAINFILSHDLEFHRSEQIKFAIEELVGDGLAAVQGAKHRRQRKVLNPTFGPLPTRALTPIFVDKAIELRDIWMSKIAAAEKLGARRVQVDLLNWFSKTALDIIGQAGFDYAFNALSSPDDQPNEMFRAVQTLMSFDPSSLSFMIPAIFPPARHIPTQRFREMIKALKVLRRICSDMVMEKEHRVMAGTVDDEKGWMKDSTQGPQERDLTALLVKANLAAEAADALNDQDLAYQIPTFVVAGHETTSTALLWTIQSLYQHPRVQDKLRAEVSAHPTDTSTPSIDELNAMPYLDAVLRESLQFHTSIPTIERVATCDMVVPIENSYVDRHGSIRDEIRLRKGDTIMIPLRSVNHSKELWGDTALEFIPERWENIPDAVQAVPGVMSSILTFGGGPYSCIGYRFSVMESKAILFTLLRSFIFEEAVPAEAIGRKTLIITRPYLKADPEQKASLPVFIRPVHVDQV